MEYVKRLNSSLAEIQQFNCFTLSVDVYMSTYSQNNLTELEIFTQPMGLLKNSSSTELF